MFIAIHMATKRSVRTKNKQDTISSRPPCGWLQKVVQLVSHTKLSTVARDLSPPAFSRSSSTLILYDERLGLCLLAHTLLRTCHWSVDSKGTKSRMCSAGMGHLQNGHLKTATPAMDKPKSMEFPTIPNGKTSSVTDERETMYNASRESCLRSYI